MTTRTKTTKVEAAELKRLTATELAEAMALTPGQLAVLDKLANGEKVERAREVLGALRLKVEYCLARPTGVQDHRIGIVLVKDPYAEGALPPAVEAELISGGDSVPHLPHWEQPAGLPAGQGAAP